MSRIKLWEKDSFWGLAFIVVLLSIFTPFVLTWINCHLYNISSERNDAYLGFTGSFLSALFIGFILYRLQSSDTSQKTKREYLIKLLLDSVSDIEGYSRQVPSSDNDTYLREMYNVLTSKIDLLLKIALLTKDYSETNKIADFRGVYDSCNKEIVALNDYIASLDDLFYVADRKVMTLRTNQVISTCNKIRLIILSI